jgi:bifunctional non-homologous end joining protein LigD
MMNDIIKHLNEEEKKLIKKDSFPEWYAPTLATLTDKRFSEPTWIYECKFDGERALTYCHQKAINILSRNHQNLNNTYPELMDAFQNTNEISFIVDGEIVAFEKEITSFSRLQKRLGVKNISREDALKVPVFYYIFDILYLDEFDLRELSLQSRKKILKKVFSYKEPLRFTEGIIEEGENYYKKACKQGWEGVIAKRLDSPYRGRRSTDWLKFKCHKSQELIIIGYTPPKGKRIGFGALLVGYYKKDALCFAGKVGTGFSEEVLKSLKAKMDKYIITHTPLLNSIYKKTFVTWLKPVLVGEFDFTECTRDGKLRHPRFKGLRMDKKAHEVIKEDPQ